MPKYDESERIYYENMKQTTLHWSNLLNPDYVDTINSQSDFEQQLVCGNYMVVLKEHRKYIPTYMYHHDLKYATLWLRMKDNKINIAFISIFSILLAFIIYLFFMSTRENVESVQQISFINKISPFDMGIGALLALGLIIGGAVFATKEVTIPRLAAFTSYIVGTCIILLRKEIAILLHPYVSPIVLMMSTLSFLLIFLTIKNLKTK